MDKFWTLLKQAVQGWVDDEASTMGASIAYYTVFSIAPLLVIAIAVAGIFFGPETIQGAMRHQMQALLGREPADAIDALLKGAAFKPDQGWIAAITGAVVMVLGATTIFGALQGALDRIWKAPKSLRPSGAFAAVRQRLLSFGIVLGIGFLMLVSMLLNTIVSAFGSWIIGATPGTTGLIQLLNEATLLVVTTLLFAMIYKFMPSVKITWSDVWLGAAVTALLLSIGRFAIGLYLGRSSTTSSYAAAGSVVILLLWIYYAAQIFLFGAEFTRAYSMSHGSRSGAAAPATDDTSTPAPEAKVAAAALVMAAAMPAGATLPTIRDNESHVASPRPTRPTTRADPAPIHLIAVGIALQLGAWLLRNRRAAHRREPDDAVTVAANRVL